MVIARQNAPIFIAKRRVYLGSDDRKSSVSLFTPPHLSQATRRISKSR